MHSMRSRNHLIVAVFTIAAAAAVTIAACGGGGGGGTMPPAPSPSPSGSILGCQVTSAPINGLVVRPLNVAPPNQDDIVPGVVAVRFASVDNKGFASAIALLHGSVRTALDAHGAGTIALPSGLDPRRAAATLRGVRGILAAGPLIVRHKLDVIPNDQFFGSLPYSVPNPTITNPPIQWDMYQMHLPAAWGQSTGFGSAGVKIAIIDTGYDTTNLDLVGRVAMSVVYDLTGAQAGQQDTNATAQDCDGHGTDTSGIAAADTNNVTYVAGVAGAVTLLEARVFPNPTNADPTPGANTQNVAAAIDWAVRSGANVISMSLGSSQPDNVYEEPAVARAIAAHVTVVAASGNGAGNPPVGQPFLDYPAADPSVIAVGASALDDSSNPRTYNGPGQPPTTEKVASYSNYVPKPVSPNVYFVVAPGGDPDLAQQNCSQNSCIDFLQWITGLYSNTAHTGHGPVILIVGTSMATPHVAGVAALMLTKDPALTPNTIGQIISTHTVVLNNPHEGHGRVDALSALNATP